MTGHYHLPATMRFCFHLLLILSLSGAGTTASLAHEPITIQAEVLNSDLMAISHGSKPGTLLVGGTDGRLLRSTNYGISWQPAHLTGKLHIVQIVAGPKQRILAVTQKGLISSSDDGQHWAQLPDPGFLANRIGYNEHLHRWIAVGTQGEIFTSQDNGIHWLAQYRTPDKAPLTTLGFAGSGYIVAAGAGGHAIFSADATHWTPLKTEVSGNINHLQPLPGQQGTLGFWSDASVTLIPADGSVPIKGQPASDEVPYITAYDPVHEQIIMATTRGHLFRSKDPTRKWEDLGSIDHILITSLLANPHTGALTAVGARGLLARSTDGGRHWERQWDDIWGASLNTVFAADDRHIVAAGTGGLMMLSQDAGQHWTLSGKNLKYYIHEIASTPDKQAVLAVGAQGFIIRSKDNGQTWSRIQSGMKPDVTLFSLLTDPRSHELMACGPMGSFLHSQDNGQTWDVTRPVREAGDGYLRQLVPADTGTLLAIGSPGRVVRSEDAGHTWQATDADTHGAGIRTAATVGRHIYLALRNDGQLLRSTDDGRHWRGTEITDAANGALYAEPATGRSWVMGRGVLYRSLDSGHSWLRTEMPGARMNFMLRTLTGTLLGFGDAGLILRSDDDGAHWRQESSGTHSALRKPLEDIASKTIFVPGRDGTLLASHDDGLHWQSIETNTPAHLNRLWLSRNGKTLIATGDRIVRLTLP